MSIFIASKNITLNNLRLNTEEYESYKILCRSIYNIAFCIGIPEDEKLIISSQVISAMKDKLDVCSLLSSFGRSKTSIVSFGRSKTSFGRSKTYDVEVERSLSKPVKTSIYSYVPQIGTCPSEGGLDVICKELYSYGESIILNEDNEDMDDEYRCGIELCDFCDIKCNGSCSNTNCKFIGVLVLHEYSCYSGTAYSFVCLDCHINKADTCLHCGMWACEC